MPNKAYRLEKVLDKNKNTWSVIRDTRVCLTKKQPMEKETQNYKKIMSNRSIELKGGGID